MLLLGEENNEELAFLDTSLKVIIESSRCRYTGSLVILIDANNTVFTTKQVVRKVLFPSG